MFVLNFLSVFKEFTLVLKKFDFIKKIQFNVNIIIWGKI